MDPAAREFHDKLFAFSEAADDIELRRMCDSGNYTFVSTTAHGASLKISKFIKSNTPLLDQSDLPALRNLAALAVQLEVRGEIETPTGKSTGDLGVLDQTINFAIAIIHEKTFHKKLLQFSDSCNTRDLINKALGKNYPINNQGFTIPPAEIGKATKIIEEFIKKNKNKLNKNDIPALERLKTLTHPLREKKRGRKVQSSLEQTITETIKSITHQEILPVDLLSIAAEFSSLEDATNLSLAYAQPKILGPAIASASKKEMDELFGVIHANFKYNREESKEQLSILLKYASDVQQGYFFEWIGEFIKDVTFLDFVLSEIPQNVKHLNLSHCSCLQSHHIDLIAQRFNLHSLNISTCKNLSDEDIIKLAKSSSMARLKSLSVGGFKLTDSAVIEIARSPFMGRLENLDVGATRISTPAVVEIAARMSNLRSLSLFSCNVSDVAIEAIAKSPAMCNLRHLDLNSTAITNTSIIKLAESPYMGNLLSLDLYNCHISDDAILKIAESPAMAHLQQLRLSGTDISDNAVLGIAKNMTGLQSLDISGCRTISDAAIIKIAESPHLAKLEELNVGLCVNLTSASIIKIAESPHMSSLKTINLYACDHISDNAIYKIAASPHMINLRRLSLPENISPAAIRAIKRSPHTESCIVDQ